MRIADQGWWCRSLQWFCDGGAQRLHDAPIAPEIGDAGIAALGMALALGGIVLIHAVTTRRLK